MSVVLDTSAVIAIADPADLHHVEAMALAQRFQQGDAEPLVTNYIVVEALSLISRRLGMDAARIVQRSVFALSRSLWITPIEHAAAVELFLDSGRSLSFVDCATMSTMRARKLQTIFTFDEDFARAGFDAVPG